MTTVYCFNNDSVEYPNAAAIIAEAEARGGHSCVIKFHLEPNMPYCLPKYVHRSVAMWVYEENVWTQRSIFGGVSDIVCEGKPH